MGRIWFVPLVVAVWVCGAETVHACSCTPRSTSCGPPGEFWRASDVFAARAVKVERGSHPTERRIRFQMIERWRGTVPDTGTVTVFTRSLSHCGYPFKEGREYLIYGTRSEDGRLTTSSCSRTAPLERAAEDLNYARDALKGISPSGRIVGDVQLKSPGRRSRGVANVRVTVTGENFVNSTRTDSQGRYGIDVSSAGRYDLEIALPTTFYAIQPRQRIDVAHPRACTERNVDAFFDGRIVGRIVDPNGRGVPGLPVAHVSVDDGSRSQQHTSVLTRDDGSFEIARLPAGRFRVQIEPPIDAEYELGDQAAVSTGVLGEGERRSLDPFTLPATLQLSRVEGIVVGSDGWSMADARIFLKGDSGERLVGLPAMSDALGRFVLTVVEGMRYHVFAERPSGESEVSDLTPITAEQRMPPLRLVVRRRF